MRTFCLWLLLAAVAGAEDSRVLSPAPATYDAFSQFASFLDAILKNYSNSTMGGAGIGVQCGTMSIRLPSQCQISRIPASSNG